MEQGSLGTAVTVWYSGYSLLPTVHRSFKHVSVTKVLNGEGTRRLGVEVTPVRLSVPVREENLDHEAPGTCVNVAVRQLALGVGLVRLSVRAEPARPLSCVVLVLAALVTGNLFRLTRTVEGTVV